MSAPRQTIPDGKLGPAERASRVGRHLGHGGAQPVRVLLPTH